MVDKKILWEGRPSLLQFFWVYVICLGIIYALNHAAYSISSYPWYYVWHVRWNKPFQYYSAEDWPQFALAAIYIIMAILILIMVDRFCKSMFTRYQLMNDQVVIRHFSFLGITIHHTEIYRLVDFEQTQPFSILIFGLSNVVLHTTDKVFPILTIGAIRGGHTVLNYVRKETERVRKQKGVREFTTRWN